jgi:hypothetical protein
MAAGPLAPPPADYLARTGANQPYVYTQFAASDADRATRTFLQMQGPFFTPAPPGAPQDPERHVVVGIHINTADRLGPGAPAGMDVTKLLAGPFLPFRYLPEVPIDIAASADVNVKRFDALGAGGRASGRMRIVFADPAGREMDIRYEIYGSTLPAESVGRDRNGRPGVTIVAGIPSAFAQISGAGFLTTAAGFVSPYSGGSGGTYGLQFSKAQLQGILDRVRALAPEMEPNAAYYRVASFGIESEVDGDGALGLNVTTPSLAIAQRR